MKKKRYRLKRQVWYTLTVILFITIAIVSIVKVRANYKYKQSVEYKLLELHYTQDDISLLKKYLSEKDLYELTKKVKDNALLKLMKAPYYIHDNLDRYLAYLKNYKNSDYSIAVLNVNLNLDYDFYENTKEANLKDDYLILVNKYYYLKEDYVPEDLVTISSKYAWGKDNKIRSAVYNAFINMWKAANEEDIYLMINLGYRSYQEQDSIYNNYLKHNNQKVTDTAIARPGFSEHQTGLALDIFELHNSNTKTFKETKAYTWLKENAYKYGFILRYTEENKNITGFNAEDWHYRYVGIEHATKIYNQNITLEEYLLKK